MNTPEIDSRLRLAVDLARRGGQLTLPLFRSRAIAYDCKGDGSPVTEADLACERFLRAEIESAFPDDAIIGEEYEQRQGASGYAWVLDPIDGTASFVRGVPLYGTLVAVMHGGRSVAGAIYLPAIDELVYAGRDLGAWYESPGAGRLPARVSSTPDAKNALLCLSPADYFRKAGTLDAMSAMAAGFGSTRGWGDCFGHLLVATGRADASVDPLVSIWDVAPAQVIIEEAGGRYSDWSGRSDIHSPHCLVSNGVVHEALLALAKRP